MKRRDFLLAASGVAGGTAATASAAAQGTTTSGGGNQSSGNESAGGNQTGGNDSTGNQTQGGGGGPTKTVTVGPGNDFVFTPGTDSPLYITPGTTVEFVWESDNHNIVVGEQPEGANWEGTKGGPSDTYNTGHTYAYTFEKKGEYHYWCEPHKPSGMVADIVVNESGQAPSGGGAQEADPEHMGVPFLAHYVGIATILMMIVSLIYTFFFLKYGESAHSSGGGQ